MKKDKFVETINSYKYKNMLSVIPLFNIFMKLKKKNKSLPKVKKYHIIKLLRYTKNSKVR